MTEYQKLYADRDPMELDEAEDYYSRHVFAMTAEGLHSKAAIAEELAFRDKRIDDLEAENTRLCDKLSRLASRSRDYIRVADPRAYIRDDPEYDSVYLELGDMLDEVERPWAYEMREEEND